MSISKVKAFLILLIALLVGMWWLALFQYSMKWDIMDITLPWNHFISECLNAGNLPLWNPYLKNGFPMMGLPDTWYPITWIISLVFGIDVWAIQMDYLLHLLIAGYGFYSYSIFKKIDVGYSLALGIAYMFSGFMIGNAQHLGWIIGAAWLPWVFYYFDKLIGGERSAHILKLTIVASLLFYGAYPPITIIIAYMLLGKLIWKLLAQPSIRHRKLFIDLAVYFILVVGSSAVGLVGLVELAPALDRGGQLPLSNTGWGVLTGFLPVHAISSLVIPYAGTSAEGFWGSDISLINCYFGFIALGLVISGLVLKIKRTWVYFLIGLLCLMIAMSELFPFRAWLYHLPLFDKFRFPSLFRLFAIFFFLMASGFAYTELLRRDNALKLFRSIFIMMVVAILGLLFYSWSKSTVDVFILLFNEGLQAFNQSGAYYDKAFVNLVIQLLLIVGVLIYSFFTKKWVKHIYIFLIIEVLLISQFNISETVVHFGDPQIGDSEINNYSGQSMTIDITKPMNTFDDGYWHEELTWFRYNQASITKTPSADGNSPFSLINHKRAKENGDLSANNYPLFFFSNITNQKIDTSTVLNKSADYIEILRATNNEFILRTNYTEETNLVFLQNNYDGWQAIVDENQVDIITVNTTFMSIPFTAGEHEVRFTFKANKIHFAFWISLISLLLVLIGIIYSEIKSYRN